MGEPNAAQYANPIPAAVRAQIARTEEAARAAGMANVPTRPPGEDDDAAPAEPAPQVAAEPAPAAEPVPPPAPINDWEQRYLTLQGKYNSEIPTLRRQVETMQAQTEGLQNLLAAMQHPAPAAAPANTTVVPKEDVEAYGEDLIAATGRWMEAKYGAEISDLKARINQLTNGQQQNQQTTLRQATLNALDADLGTGWRKVNEEPAFIAWLDETDPFSGRSRKELLGEAYNSGDARRTAEFFRRYQTEQTAVSQPPPAQPLHTPSAPAGGTARVQLADLAAPGRVSAPAPSGAPTDKRQWTGPEITAFYQRKMRGAFIGREAEAQRLENDIIAATTEGRIR